MDMATRQLVSEPTRAFLAAPVGDGAFRWVRSVPGQFIELAAVPDFFLGVPKVRRLFFRTAADPEARINLLLSGEADATDNIPVPPLSNIERVDAAPGLRAVPVASPILGYLLFNQRDRTDSTKPHPILSDVNVRRAIATIGLSSHQLWRSYPTGCGVAVRSNRPEPAATTGQRRDSPR